MFKIKPKYVNWVKKIKPQCSANYPIVTWSQAHADATGATCPSAQSPENLFLKKIMMERIAISSSLFAPSLPVSHSHPPSSLAAAPVRTPKTIISRIFVFQIATTMATLL
jgi:hypothetical protein